MASIQGMMYGPTSAAMAGSDSFADRSITPLFSGFHIDEGSGSYYYPPPAHQNSYNSGGSQGHAHNHAVITASHNNASLPPPPAYSHLEHNGYLDAEMDIKIEPDTLMESYPSPESSVVSQGSSSPQSSPQGSGGAGAAGAPSRIRKNKEDKQCGVCGDRALGYNFDAISCESCKAFFRRNAPKGLDYFKCPYDEKCKMDISNRRFCKRCRLKKCFEIGMRKEYILTDEEKARKRLKIEENSREKCVTPRMGKPMSFGDGILEELENQQACWIRNEPVSSQTIALTEEESAEIEELMQAYRSSLEITIEKDIPRDTLTQMTDLVNIAELSVRRVIDMAKKVKSFKALTQGDQIQLLKGGSIELLILRSVLTFDKEKQHFLDATDDVDAKAVSIDQMRQVENGTGLFEDHMKFVKSLAVDLRADETTMILLLMISLFSPDRGHLNDKVLVEEEQEKYSMLLKKYLESSYPYALAQTVYPKLLMKLTDIRNLNEEHSQVLLKVNPEGIQPLMQEVLDLRF